jgi:hypothetical protein
MVVSVLELTFTKEGRVFKLGSKKQTMKRPRTRASYCKQGRRQSSGGLFSFLLGHGSSTLQLRV